MKIFLAIEAFLDMVAAWIKDNQGVVLDSGIWWIS